MRRIACVFLPYWAIERRGTPPDKAPRICVASQSGGFRVSAVDARAEALGVGVGELLADVRARIGTLCILQAEPEADRAALTRLAHWCTRFSPLVAPWHEGCGLTLDIEGCAELFGGEAALARLIGEKLSGLGLTARVAVAGTIGAAHALACCGKSAIIPNGEEEAALASLPVAALRIPAETASALRRLGLSKIGDLIHLPRAPLGKRFGKLLLERLDGARGRMPESFSPLHPPVEYRAQTALAEPISSQDHVLVLLERLFGELCVPLARDGKGAQSLRLTLFRVDGAVTELTVGVGRPTRDGAHVVKLFRLRLDALAEGYDAGFGFDAARLDTLSAGRVGEEQKAFESDTRARDFSLLIDRLGSRLGVENILRLHRADTHIPERAVVARPAAGAPQPDWTAAEALRPLLMLPAPEPADVIALLPEGAPQSFRWRGVRYSVASAEGPERIRPEWWKKHGAIRDYYILSDEEGRGFWIYRRGRYGGDREPGWFVHGIFA